MFRWIKRHHTKGERKPAIRMSDLSSLPEVLTVDEVAKYLRVERRTVINNLILTGKLPATKVGLQWRIARAALEKFLKSAEFKNRGTVA